MTTTPDQNETAQASCAPADGSPIFTVFHKPTGKVFGTDGFWEDHAKHLESHLLIGPTGRVFWEQHNGLKEITDECELRLSLGNGLDQATLTRPAANTQPTE